MISLPFLEEWGKGCRNNLRCDRAALHTDSQIVVYVDHTFQASANEAEETEERLKRNS